MEITDIKNDLHDRIEHANDSQIQAIYGLVLNYFNNQDDAGDWNNIPQWQKDKIEEGLRQADAKLGRPLVDFIRETRNKFGLNG